MEHIMSIVRNIFLALTLAVTILPSCREQDEVYKDFYNEANRHVYPQRAENLKAVPGLYRSQVSFLKAVDPRVASAKVFWNNGQDSVAINMKDPAHMVEDTIYVNIDNLEDVSYTFTVYNYDAMGNRSVPSEVTTTVRGETYVNSLSNRSVTSAVALSEKESVIKWGGKTSGLKYTVFKYRAKGGIHKEINLPNTQNQLVLNDVDFDNPECFQWKSVYFFQDCLDTLYGKWVTSDNPLEYDYDYSDELQEGVEYYKPSGSFSRCSLSRPDADNPYDFLIECVTTGSPWIVMEALSQKKPGSVLVFQYKIEQPISNAVIYWIGHESALSTSKRSGISDLAVSDDGGWSVWKKNMEVELGKFEWKGEPGDYFRLDLWNMTQGQKVRIRNIHFRPARAGE